MLADRSGAIAILFGLVVFVLLGFVALALDYTRGTSTRTRLQSSLDAATLSVATFAQKMLADGASVGEARASADEHGAAFLKANVHGIDGSVSEPRFDIQFSGGTWSVKASVDASIDTTFGRIFGSKSFQPTVVSEAVMGGITYADFYLLLDTSHSMGVGATSFAIAQLEATVGCAFACHSPTRDTYAQARAANIPLRIDLMSDATNVVIDEAISAAQASDQFRMGIWTFSNSFNQLIAPTDRLGDAKGVTSQITLAEIEDGTQFDDAVLSLDRELTATGDGSKSDRPKKVVLIVTDGVQDGFYTGWMPPVGLPTSDPSRMSVSGGMESPVSPMACDGLKAKGITVAILYTPYLKFNNPDYDLLVGPYADRIEPNLKTCASDGFFFKTPDVLSANVDDFEISMKKMFIETLRSVKGVRIAK